MADKEPVEGYDPQQLDQDATAVEEAVSTALQLTAASVASDVAGSVAPSPIDAATVPGLWAEVVEDKLKPLISDIIYGTAETIRLGIAAAGERLYKDPAITPTEVLDPQPILNVTADALLNHATNRMVGIGNDLWLNIQQSLVEGTQAGDGIPELAARVREAALLTEPRSRVVARTEVIAASNGASIAQARTAGVPLEKTWLATPDARTRLSHVEADGQTVPLNEPFMVGDPIAYPLDFPGDPSGPASEVINCRCTPIFSLLRVPEVDVTVAAESRIHLFTCLTPLHHGPCAKLGPDGLPLRKPRKSRGAKARNGAMDAETPASVSHAAAREAKRLTGRDINFSLDDADPEVAQGIASGILKGLKRFPEVPLAQVTVGDSAERDSHFAEAKGNDIPGAGPHQTMLYGPTDRIEIQRWWAQHPQELAAEMRKAHDNKKLVGDSIADIGLHEFGHVLVAALKGNRHESVGETIAKNRMADIDTWKDDYEGPETARELAAAEISERAGGNGLELDAEAFTDVMLNGEKASALSKDIFAEIERLYAEAYAKPTTAGAETGKALTAALSGEALARFNELHPRTRGKFGKKGELASSVASGIRGRRSLNAGTANEVDLVTFNDGSQAIYKKSGREDPEARKREMDAEELGMHVGRAIGAPSPEVFRISDDEIYMKYVEDATLGVEANSPEIRNSDDARRVALLDILIENPDRHTSNWLVKDGRVIPIDNGKGWSELRIPDGSGRDVSASAPPSMKGVLIQAFAKSSYPKYDDVSNPNMSEWIDNDLSAYGLRKLGENLDALEPEFDRLGRGYWFRRMIQRLSQVEQHATGSRRLS